MKLWLIFIFTFGFILYYLIFPKYVHDFYNIKTSKFTKGQILYDSTYTSHLELSNAQRHKAEKSAGPGEGRGEGSI